jgi:hypothetical protein
VHVGRRENNGFLFNSQDIDTYVLIVDSYDSIAENKRGRSLGDCYGSYDDDVIDTNDESSWRINHSIAYPVLSLSMLI